MAAAVDTESGHFFDAVCFRLEQPRGCAGALFLGLAMALPAGAGFAGLFCPGVGADADIQTISVSAQYQGNGIGQGLLDLLINAAIERSAPVIFLEVRAENEQARALYAKNGFTQISVRKNYYQNAQPRSKRSDAIIMQKTLGVAHE